MTYERKDFESLRETERRQRDDQAAKQHMNAIGRLAQAAVPAASLMADPKWALYQQMLQASLERVRANRDRLVETLTSAACSSAEQMTRLKILIAECDGLINAWQTAIDLPKQLHDSARAAQDTLNAQLERHDEATRTAA